MNSVVIKSGMSRHRRGTLSLLYRQTQAASFTTSKDGKDKKENFAKKFLEPAARGELHKHQSGIPKLAVKKHKGHSVKDAFPGKESEEIIKNTINLKLGATDATVGAGSLQTDDLGKTDAERTMHQQRTNMKLMSQMALESLFEGAKPHDLDSGLRENHHKWLGTKQSIQQSLFRQQRNIKQQGQRGGPDGSRPKYDMWGDEEHQPDLDDPWITDAMYFRYENPHVESKREPKPIVFPTNRVNPPEEFVVAHGAFAYVTNVPRPLVNGEVGSYKNPLHRHEVTEFVADVFSVPASHVFCATMTSAFVGFKDAKEAAQAVIRSEGKRIITGKKIEATLYSEKETPSEEEKDFVMNASSADAVIRLENIPVGMKSGTVARILRRVADIEGKDVLMSTPTTALLRMSSNQAATSLLKNRRMNETLASIQRQILRVHCARRELVHDRFSGPVRQFQLKKFTNRLIVDGDVPSRDFFLSHAGVLHLCNVPAGINKEVISAFFQKFCAERRDVEGSIEIVKSLDGHPTGRVYVGFDLERECTEAWKELLASGQKIMLNKAGPAARVRPVKEVALPRGTKLGDRSERTQEELIASFKEWKNYVDPKDIEILESYGVTMDVLEEAFTAARNNPTFGVEDQARQGERLRNEYAPGGHFREFVQMYIDTLKELGTTKENPGLKYEGMFLPDEEVDYDLFDEEKERLASLRERFSR
jgi:hypothetical protein